jgi:hypothetical protein
MRAVPQYSRNGFHLWHQIGYKLVVSGWEWHHRIHVVFKEPKYDKKRADSLHDVTFALSNHF